MYRFTQTLMTILISICSIYCQQCSNPYCQDCNPLEPNKCTDCGDSTVTKRDLIDGNCVCKENYINVPWSFYCQSTQDLKIQATKFDIRMLRFKNNVENQDNIIKLQTYVPNSAIATASLVENLTNTTKIMDYTGVTCGLGTEMDEAFDSACPDGQLFQKLDKNIFGLAYLQNNKTGTTWKNSYLSLGLDISSRFEETRNLTKIYNIKGFQFLKTSGTGLLIECLIVEYLQTYFLDGTRLLQTLDEPYMQYLFYVAYKRTTVLNYIELQDMIDRMMALINGCMDFCNDCSIVRNSTLCNTCQGNRVFQNGQCRCLQTAALAESCASKCDPWCQSCIQDCYSCIDVTKKDYSQICIEPIPIVIVPITAEPSQPIESTTPSSVVETTITQSVTTQPTVSETIPSQIATSVPVSTTQSIPSEPITSESVASESTSSVVIIPQSISQTTTVTTSQTTLSSETNNQSTNIQNQTSNTVTIEESTLTSGSVTSQPATSQSSTTLPSTTTQKITQTSTNTSSEPSPQLLLASTTSDILISETAPTKSSITEPSLFQPSQTVSVPETTQPSETTATQAKSTSSETAQQSQASSEQKISESIAQQLIIQQQQITSEAETKTQQTSNESTKNVVSVSQGQTNESSSPSESITKQSTVSSTEPSIVAPPLSESTKTEPATSASQTSKPVIITHLTQNKSTTTTVSVTQGKTNKSQSITESIITQATISSPEPSILGSPSSESTKTETVVSASEPSLIESTQPSPSEKTLIVVNTNPTVPESTPINTQESIPSNQQTQIFAGSTSQQSTQPLASSQPSKGLAATRAQSSELPPCIKQNQTSNAGSIPLNNIQPESSQNVVYCDEIVQTPPVLNEQSSSGTDDSVTYGLAGAGAAVGGLGLGFVIIGGLLKKSAAQFIAQHAVDALGLAWPHRLLSAPAGMQASAWEAPVQFDDLPVAQVDG